MEILQIGLTLIWYSACIGLGARIGWNFIEGAWEVYDAFMTGYRRARK